MATQWIARELEADLKKRFVRNEEEELSLLASN
jgi:hypothetical protein